MPTFRTIIEKSSMSNNDEYVIYTDNLLKGEWKDLPIETRKLIGTRITSFDDPKIVISRSLFDFEREEGLVLENGSIFDRKEPKITKLLDTITSLKERYGFYNKIMKMNNKDKMDIGKFLIHRIAYDYYDCMSGGCSKFLLILAKYYFTVINPEYDRNTYIYPCGTKEEPDKFVSLQDFLDEIKDENINEIDDILSNIKNKYGLYFEDKVRKMLCFTE